MVTIIDLHFIEHSFIIETMYAVHTATYYYIHSTQIIAY
jgi:hypothetical protein